MIKQDQLWPGGFRFLFDDELFKPGTDSFLLGSFPRLRRGERVCDLGAGTGLLGLLLLAREPDLQVTNVELQAAAVALAAQSWGSFCLVFRAERMPELFACLKGCGMEPKRLRLVQNTAQAAPKLLLLEAKKGGRPGLAVLPPLLLRDPDGGESAELSRIYFRDKE